MSTLNQPLTPTKITYRRNERCLELTYDNEILSVPAELLRVFSPSAEVRGHSPKERKIQVGKKYVGITRIDAVGNYAIRIVFDDGHDTGLYSWDLLHDIGKNEGRYWEEYRLELKQNNASRLPTIKVGHWSP
tara:strand:+ start:240 stop:635 length:396 start_codon:yes stop_codon:yes gene_type:complete